MSSSSTTNGCGSISSYTVPEDRGRVWGKEEEEAVKRAEKADVVIFGYGASGLAAAVSAAAGGARVIVFEKMAVPGGSANFAEGIFAAESSLQRRKNILITRDRMFKLIMDYSHWRANARLVRQIVDKSADTIEWLEDMGVQFVEPVAIYPGGLPTWHIIKGGGKKMCRALARRAKELGVRVFLKTPIRELKRNGGDGSYDLWAEPSKGGPVRVVSKTVIISSGGFANNSEMLEKYTDFGRDGMPVASVGKTGDGILSAWALGAAQEGTSVLQLYRPGVQGEGPTSHLNAAGRQPYLWVNRDGERFCDESIIFQWPFAGNALAKQKKGVMYTLFDGNTKRYMMEKGLDVGVGVLVPVTTKLENLDRDVERGTEKKEVVVCDSVGEMAVALRMKEDVLCLTVEEYNRCCDIRSDVLFAKDPRYLQPVRTPPFYAIRLRPTFLATLGGIKINRDTEVLDTGGEIIPGLYAVGNVAGGMYGDSYDLTVPGGTLGFAVNSGRIAGEKALAFASLKR